MEQVSILASPRGDQCRSIDTGDRCRSIDTRETAETGCWVTFPSVRIGCPALSFDRREFRACLEALAFGLLSDPARVQFPATPAASKVSPLSWTV